MKRKPAGSFIFLSIVLGMFMLVQCKQQEKKEERKTNAPAAPEDELSRLTKQLIEDPGNPDLLYQRAKYFIDHKRFQNALNDINRAVGIDSTRVDFLMVKADAHFGLIQVPPAIETFRKILSLNPGEADAHLKLAELFLYLKEYKQCLQHASDALRIDKTRAKAYFIKGFVYKETGDTTKAISSFQTCVEQEPQNYDAYLQIGILYASQRNKLALQYYNSALKINPRSTEALYDRGLFYQESAEYNRAMEDYNTILQIDPKFKDAHFNLGYIHLAYLKVYRQAIKHFSDAIAVEPYYAEAFYNRGIAYESLGDIRAAAEDYRKALEIYPKYGLAKDGLYRVTH